MATKKPAKKIAKKSAAQTTTHGVPDYGVLRGVLVEHGREDADPQSPHLQVIVEAGGERWRCAINVLSSDKKASPDEKEIRFAITDPLVGHPILGQLAGLPQGFTPLPGHKPGRTLDFVRERPFEATDLRHLPFFQPGVGDDLQDLLEVHVNKAEGRPAAEAEVFVWGSRFSSAKNPLPPDKKFKTKKGVHNVHMNQGNPLGAHFGDNGIFQDGAMLFRFSNPDRVVGIFLKFESQSLQTDDQGRPGTGGTKGTPDLAHPSVAIVAALVNAAGEEVGHETVTLLNTLALPVNLAGWTIVDRDGHSDALDGVQLTAGESRLIVLTGAGARLGNKGGSLNLLDKNSVRVHSVTWSQEDAGEEGRTIVF